MDRRYFFKVSLLSGAAFSFMGKLTPQAKASDAPLTEYPVSEYFTETYNFTHPELIELAKKHGTPLYVYDGDLMVERFQEFSSAFKKNYPKVKVHYAFKANTNLNVLSLLQKQGADAECISEGEMRLGLKTGYSPEKMIFTSSSKSTRELEFAVTNNIMINVDSIPDLENLMAVTERLKKKSRISFRINPDVNPNTHKNISTGHKLSKFGILQIDGEIKAAYERAMKHPYLKPIGVHSHIGSQILDLKPFLENVEIVTTVALMLKKELGLELEFINLGGGIGIPYRDGEKPLSPDEVARTICPVIKEKLKEFSTLPELWLEPGRYFTAQSGILISRVNSVKMTRFQNFVNVDTGFNHLARPLLYQAHHRVRILGATKAQMAEQQLYQVAGNICETGDILAHERKLPSPKAGDYLAFLDTGAYGFSMSSEYNTFNLPAEVMRRKKKFYLIRKREDFDNFLRNQVIHKEM